VVITIAESVLGGWCKKNRNIKQIHRIISARDLLQAEGEMKHLFPEITKLLKIYYRTAEC